MDNWFTYFGTELLGSMILIILGNGVVANVLLKGTKAHNSSFLIVALGWGFAVAVGVLVAGALGGPAHLNPAVTLAFVVNHWTDKVGAWGLFPIIILGQLLGFILGQILVDLVYFLQIKDYFIKLNEDFNTNATKSVLGMHATIPQNRIPWTNIIMELAGSMILIISVLALGKFSGLPFYLVPFFVMVVVMGIGCSLSGTTGYAINPFRDLMPRIVYQVLILLPFVKQKESADWKYSWVPIVAPVSAGLIIGALFLI